MNEPSSLNIKQIAEMAGVSVATVSRVINQNGRFSADTEARVRKVIAECGYVPNIVAKGLRTSKTNVIGVVVPDILNPHFAGLVLELEKTLFKQSYSTVICNTNESADLEKRHIDTLVAQHVSGIIIISGSNAGGVTKDIPAVYLDRRPIGYSEPSDLLLIESDNQTGGYLATSKLISSGCKNIAVVRSKIMDYNQSARFAGFSQAMQAAGLPIDEDSIMVLDEVSVAGAREKILGEFPSHKKIDGIMCMTDTIALGVMTGLHELQVKIPAEVSVTGYDDAPLAEFFQPPLTTIRQDVPEMARTAAQYILGMINGQRPEQRHQIIPVKLVSRKSTK
jgi:LacI family transcriptional regulator